MKKELKLIIEKATEGLREEAKELVKEHDALKPRAINNYKQGNLEEAFEFYNQMYWNMEEAINLVKGECDEDWYNKVEHAENTREKIMDEIELIPVNNSLKSKEFVLFNTNLEKYFLLEPLARSFHEKKELEQALDLHLQLDDLLSEIILFGDKDRKKWIQEMKYNTQVIRDIRYECSIKKNLEVSLEKEFYKLNGEINNTQDLDLPIIFEPTKKQQKYNFN